MSWVENIKCARCGPTVWVIRNKGWECVECHTEMSSEQIRKWQEAAKA